MALWTPANLGAKLLRWWSARDFAGYANQQKVRSWTSRAAGGHVANVRDNTSTTAYDSSVKAVYFFSSNAQKPGLSFDATGLPVGSSPGVTFIFGQTNAGKRGLASYGNYNTFRWQGSYSSGVYGGFRKDSQTDTATTASYPGDTRAIFADVEGGSSSSSYLRINGGSITSATTTRTINTTIPSTYTLGADGHGWIGQFQGFEGAGGYIWEVIYTDALTANEIERVEGYIAWEWGYQGNLPAGHAYRNAAPTTDETVVANGSAAGSSSPIGEGRATAVAAGSSSGSTAATGAGASTATITGSAAGSTTAAGAGATIVTAIGAAIGTTTAAGAASSTVTANGTAAGSSAVAGEAVVGNASRADGTSAGSSTVSGQGASLARSIGTVSGVTAATGAGATTVTATGSAFGSTLIRGIGQSNAAANATASSRTVAIGAASVTATSDGTAVGISAVVGISRNVQRGLVPSSRVVISQNTVRLTNSRPVSRLAA